MTPDREISTASKRKIKRGMFFHSYLAFILERILHPAGCRFRLKLNVAGHAPHLGNPWLGDVLSFYPFPVILIIRKEALVFARHQRR